MQGIRPKATGGASAGGAVEEDSSSSLTLLTMYSDAPHVEVTIDDFEIYALNRLKGRYQV